MNSLKKINLAIACLVILLGLEGSLALAAGPSDAVRIVQQATGGQAKFVGESNGKYKVRVVVNGNVKECIVNAKSGAIERC
ncbi:MAG: hypothetical protein WBD37_02755 [Anderseniella sp.]